jgi:hypothetical protein
MSWRNSSDLAETPGPPKEVFRGLLFGFHFNEEFN